jgi:O-antigen/teichoic acid export membrane protein
MDTASSRVDAPAAARDAQLAIWNALRLYASYAVTWSVALAVRFVLPRALSPEGYGDYNFADAFAATGFVLLGLGLETYAQKEIAIRASHASEFFGGTLALRLVLGVAILFGLELSLRGRPADVLHATLVFGAGQLFFNVNTTLAAFLHARGKVSGLSVANVISKALWGLGIALCLFRGASLIALAAAFSFSEATRTCALGWLCRRHLGLALRIDLAACGRVLRAALPFFITTLSVTLFARLDDTLIGFFANDREVGLYGLASNLAQLALLFTPMVGAVLLPLFSRAAARSMEELAQVMSRSLELLLAITLPLELMLLLGAEEWLRLLGGPAFAAAAPALRVLSPVLVFSYVGMLCADALYLLGRSWRVTLTCLAGLCGNALMNGLLIRPALAHFGEGGAGIASATATVATEAITTGLFVLQIGRRLVDARLRDRAVRSLAVCAFVVGLHEVLGALGPLRLLIDAIAYAALALAFGAVRPKDLLAFVRQARPR